MKTKNYIFLILNLIVATSYYFINYLPIPKDYFQIASLLWNTILGLLLALIFIKKDFFSQIKSFSLKWLILGVSLTSFFAYLGNYFYSTYIATPTTNILFKSLTIENIIFVLPILALGEELLSTNITTALNKIGLNFWVSTFLVAILFAFWHINSFGFVPLQLLAIISPIRIALNYTWKESNSIFTVWFTHYLFNILYFTIFL